jgi:hypothetical protein
VTDVTGVGIRIVNEENTDCHDQFANWSRNDKRILRRAFFQKLLTEEYLGDIILISNPRRHENHERNRVEE